MNFQYLSEDAGKCIIPVIDDAELKRLVSLFTPLFRRDDVVYRLEIPDLRLVAFTWDPKFLEPVDFSPVTTLKTHHGCSYYGFFKPSIAEVLAQIPDDIPKGVNAFYIDMEAELGIFHEGDGHLATTVFGII